MKELGYKLMIVPSALWALGWTTGALWAGASGYAGHDMGPFATGLLCWTLAAALWCATSGAFLVWWSNR